MALQDAKAFIERVQKDEGLQKKFRDAGQPADRETALQRAVEHGQAAGHSFTGDEYEAALREHLQARQSGSGRLDDAALETASGGGTAGTCNCTPYGTCYEP